MNGAGSLCKCASNCSSQPSIAAALATQIVAMRARELQRAINVYAVVRF